MSSKMSFNGDLDTMERNPPTITKEKRKTASQADT